MDPSAIEVKLGGPCGHPTTEVARLEAVVSRAASSLFAWVALAAACTVESGIQEEPNTPPESGTSAPDWHTDEFSIGIEMPIDVLFVIDNSASMAAEQDLLGWSFPLMFDSLVETGFDFHIGVISTDMYTTGHQGRLQPVGDHRWVQPDTPDAADVFAEMVSMGTNGSRTERGLDATYAALETLGDTANIGFFREDAAIHTVVITDEGSQTHDLTIDEFIGWYEDLKVRPEMRTFSGVYGDGARDYGLVTEAVGGSGGSLEADWRYTMSHLTDIVQGREREFVLSRRPQEDTIRVFLDVPTEGGGRDLLEVAPDDPLYAWQYYWVTNSVGLASTPPMFARVSISYAPSLGR